MEQNKAIERLEKLLVKQQAEAKETENLLRSLSTKLTSSYNGTFSDSSLESLTKDEYQGLHNEKNSNLPPIAGMDIASFVSTGIDYGFISRSEGNQRGNLVGGLPVEGYYTNSPAFENYGPPTNVLFLGLTAFVRNLQAIRGEYTNEENTELSQHQVKLQEKLKKLTLNSTAIWEREKKTEVEAPLIIKIPYLVICYLLDFVFEGRYVPSRFYLLETVARTPYFSYIAMLHFYETLGWWRRSSDVKRVHFAEEWNEFHHLLIMESLGGDQEWWVRFAAMHAAIVYYWTLILLWLISPTLGYKFSELLETHAVNTYSQFVDENEDILKELPPSLPAIEYYGYGSSDPLFGEYQTSAIAKGEQPRRPGENMKNLYDVFSAIRDDEGDHVSTMKACLDPNVAVQSPAIEKQILVGGAILAAVSYFVSTGDFAGFESLDLDTIIDTVEESPILDSLSEFDLNGLTNLGEQLLTEEEDAGSLINQLLVDGTVLASLDGLRQVAVKFLEFILEHIR